MKTRYLIFILNTIILILGGCDSKSEVSSSGIWIGNYSINIWQIDFPVLLDLGENEGDSLYWKSWSSNHPPLSAFIKKDSAFWLDTIAYHPISLTNERLVLETRKDSVKENHIPYVFYRPSQTSFTAKPQEIEEMLIGKAWISTEKKPNQWFRSNEKTWYTSDKKFIQRSYTYKGKALFDEWETQCYEIDSYKDLRLLVLSRDFSDCKGYNHAIRQILDLNSNSLTVQFATRDNIRTEVYKPTMTKIKSPPPETEAFRFCNSTHIRPYFYSEAHYTGGRKAIKQHFEKQFDATSQNKNLSGYLTIQFFINCEGDIGKFEILGTDMDYQPIAFPPELVKELLLQVKSLSDWIPGKDHENQPVDSQFFLSFKYENGQLSEIVP